MKKVLKRIVKVMLGLLIALVVFLAGLYIFNKIMIQKEKPLVENPLGQMVEVDGNEMCIYTEGEGDHTIVFMSGYGTPEPILDFKPLWSRLSSDYRIVVIEKFGYGFSDSVETERSFETILRQDREALNKLGIEGPFILCPHSMSGIEAMLWEIEYPEEVEAIVGLDIAYPNEYMEWGDEPDGASMMGSARLINNLGIYRLFGEKMWDNGLPAFGSGVLTKEEREIYKAIIFAKGYNKTLENETLENDITASQKILENPKPECPVLIFTSLGEGDPNDKEAVEKWRGYAKDYTSDMSNATLIELDCGHYVHCFEADKIESEMRSFIENIENEDEEK